jgi:hypothetical protein
MPPSALSARLESRIEMTTLPGHLITRRTLIGAGALALAAATTASLGRSSAGDQAVPTPVISGDCADEPGVQLLVEWRLGLPVMTLEELLPPRSWVRYLHPTMPVTFLYPPDWREQPLWADRFSREGVPLWTDQPMAMPQLTSERLISPDGDALFEFAGGTIVGAALAPGEAATIAELGVVGEEARLRSICSYEDANPLVPGWFHAARVEDAVLVTYGWPIANATALWPNTVVYYYSMLGPRDRFDDLMRTVYIPILFQLTGIGGGPTPTPDD